METAIPLSYLQPLPSRLNASVGSDNATADGFCVKQKGADIAGYEDVRVDLSAMTGRGLSARRPDRPSACKSRYRDVG